MAPSPPARSYYQAYGLRICSAFPIATLPASDGGPADIVIDPANDAIGANHGTHLGVDNEVTFRDKSGTINVRDGRYITASFSGEVTLEKTHSLLACRALAISLFQRGLLTLHASAVAIEGRAIVLAGRVAAGKSTLAAALCSRGHDLLTDDVAAIETKGTIPTILPGVPSIKLREDAAAVIGEPTPQLLGAKRLRDMSAGFRRTPCPIDSVLAVRRSPTVTVQQLSPKDAVLEIVAQSYVVTPVALHPGHLARHFRQCADLAEKVATSQMGRGDSLAELANAVDAIERLVGAPSSPAVGRVSETT